MRIRILKQKRKPSFSETLEQKVRSAVGEKAPGDTFVTATIHRQMALALDQLDQTRSLHDAFRRKLFRLECYVDTEILQIGPREPVYIDERWHDRQMLKRKLLFINNERRKLAMAEQEKLQALHDRLLSLWNKYRQISL